MPGPDLRILMLHARYRQGGGEDVSAQTEADSLRARGHHVDLMTFGPPTLSSAVGAVWNPVAAALVRRAIAGTRYDIVHAQNLFPAASVSVLRAARQAGAAVVGTVRNVRFLCPAGTFWNSGPCMACKHGRWPGIRQGCWKGSRLATAGSALVQAVAVRQWQRLDAVIAPSAYLADVLSPVLNAATLHVVPNQVPPMLPGVGERQGIVFAGRLTPEKGLDVLLNAFGDLPQGARLRIFGTGPEASVLRSRDRPGVQWDGDAAHPQVLEAMRQAAVVVVPSRWAEPFGRVALEAMAAGAAVVATGVGGLPEVVGDAGLTVPAGDVTALGQALRMALANHRALGAAGRQRYEAVFADAPARVEALYLSVLHARRTSQLMASREKAGTVRV